MDAAAEPVGTAPAAGAAANARRAVRRPIRTVGRMRMWARVASSSTVMDARGARRGPLHPASAPSPTVSVMDAAQGSDMRFLLVVRDFGGMTSGAVRQDLKVGVERLRTWKRIALVTDLDRMTRLSAFFGWMTPGGTKAFPLAAREEASARASGRDPDARPARGPAR
ncbi:STAS/SEC14 domain-containing protein [Streptomyces sp. NPDC004284]|uniref:STAS/SEC14 domain-containing protein n=1 Tax=Streptomyces sp. NPDC004284 TaxID=3364695 RepID=UPI00368B8325